MGDTYFTEDVGSFWPQDDEVRDAAERGKGWQLRERTLEFAVRLSTFCDELAPMSFTARETARQLYRSGASVGANLEEADAAQSRADFVSKCSISLKEARETRYWLRVTAKRFTKLDLSWYLSESHQFVAILTTIIRKSRNT